MYYVDCILTDTQRQGLTEAGVTFSDVSIGPAAFCRRGIAFSETATESVVSILGILRNPDGLTDHLYDHVTSNPVSGPDNDYLRTIAVHPTPTAQNPVLFLTASGRPYQTSRHDSGHALMSTLTQSFPELRMGMVFQEVSGRARPFTATPNLIQIYSDSYPEGLESGAMHCGSDGFNVVRRVIGPTRDYFVVREPSGRYIALFKGDADGGTVWTLFDQYSVNDYRGVISYVMYAVARHLHPELGAIDDFVTFISKAPLRAYLATARERVRVEIRNLPRQLESAHADLARAEAAFAVAVRAEELARHRAQANVDENALIETMVSKMEREYSHLLASPEFTSVEIAGDQLAAVTRPIEIVHNGIVYEMGAYRIQLSLSANGLPTISSLVRSPRGEEGHPHLNGTSPCFGNQRDNFIRMLASHEYSTVLPLIVLYLETGYTPADSYTRIEDINVPTHLVQEIA